MSNNKQTAVEWLMAELNQELNYVPITQWDRIRDLVQRAKQMEKQQRQIELPSDEEIIQWAKKQAEIEPTGAEEFGRIYGAKWMRDKIKEVTNDN